MFPLSSYLFARERFFRLDDEERRRVLRGPLGEVVQMLEENLLNKFWGHVAKERGEPALQSVIMSNSSQTSQ